jgi:hypothetical protein
MSPAEVLGVEIVNYEGDGLRALVPRIVGLTEAAREHKATGSRQSMDEIWAAAPDSTLRARQLLDGWATELHIQQWDSGKSRRYGPSSTSRPPVFLYPTYDQVFLMLKHVPTADAEQARHTLAQMLGHPVASKEPGIGCTDLVERWPEFESRLLTPLMRTAMRAPE